MSSKARNAALAIGITMGIGATLVALWFGGAWLFNRFGANIVLGTFSALFFGGIIAMSIFDTLERKAYR